MDNTALWRRNSLLPAIIFFIVSASRLSMAQEPVKYIALGDSYTIGESVSLSERWPVQLSLKIRETGIDISDPVIVARTGWTTDELSKAIEESGIVDDFDIVTLLIGVNNQYRGRDTANYRAELKKLINRAIGFAGGNTARIIMISIPDWGVMPFAEGRDRARISAEIDLFNHIIKSESESMGMGFIDITPVSRMAGKDPQLVAGDGLHPSGAMYSLWVDLIFPKAVEILGY